MATAINAQGDIAGYYFDAVNKAHGFILSASGWTYQTIDLGTGGTRIYGINSSDQISGYYQTGAHVMTDFIGAAESAAPEPTTVALIGAGLILIGSRKRWPNLSA